MRPAAAAGAFVLLQRLLPQHALSRLIHRVARVRLRPLKDLLIRGFVRGFQPAMQDAAQPDPLAYGSFNEFFTRRLRAGARPIARDADLVASPVDGTISQIGYLEGQSILQAKGRRYGLAALLAGDEQWQQRLQGGAFATLYLAPHNYHRIHMPLDGRLQRAWYVPGRLFSVNAVTAAAVEGLFARNERVVCAWEGPPAAFAMVLVGALFVGSIATVWHGEITPRRRRPPFALQPSPAAPLQLPKGAEMGRFNMGSTVILLFPPGAIQWLPGLTAGSRISMGMPLARLQR